MKRVLATGLALALMLSATPAVFAAEASGTAYPSTQIVTVDGKAVEFQCYALKNAAGNDTNYIKLRDLANILNGSAVQFEVGWDGAVNIETGKPYTKNGSEMNTPFSGARTYEAATAPTNINGKAAALDAIVLKDDGGNGYTYYKLRDLGAALGFTVDWSAEKGIFIKTEAKDSVVLTAPQLLYVEPSIERDQIFGNRPCIRLTWTAVNGAADYEVWYKRGEYAQWYSYPIRPGTISPDSSGNCHHTFLYGGMSDVKVWFKVRAYVTNADGSKTYSDYSDTFAEVFPSIK